MALKGLSTNKNIVIQKLAEGNSAVLLNRNDYIEQMKEMLSDSSKFKKLEIKLGKRMILYYKKAIGSLVFWIEYKGLSMVSYIKSFI